MTQKQTILKIEAPNGARVYPSDFRGALAMQAGLPNALFHRDAQGASMQGKPGIRVAGAKGWVGLVADPGFESLLFGAIGQAMAAANHLAQVPCRVQIEERDFDITQAHEPVIYWLREMALKRRTRPKREADVEELITRELSKCIEDTGRRFGLDVPVDLGVMVSEVTHQRGLLLQTTTGTTKEAVHLVDAVVLIHANLDGHWFAGNLTSRGYGRIIKPLPGTQMDQHQRPGKLLV